MKLLPLPGDSGPPRVFPIAGLIHAMPSTQPFCAMCAAFLAGWPFCGATCAKCEGK